MYRYSIYRTSIDVLICVFSAVKSSSSIKCCCSVTCRPFKSIYYRSLSLFLKKTSSAPGPNSQKCLTKKCLFVLLEIIQILDKCCHNCKCILMLNILVFVNIGTVNISIVTLELLNIYIFSKFFSFFQKLFHPGSIVPKNI